MPNLASISALPVHSAVAPKEKDPASNKSSNENGSNSEFGELVRRQAGPLQPPSQPELRIGVADDSSGSVTASMVQGTRVLHSPVEDECQSPSSLVQPATTIAEGLKTAVAGSDTNTPMLLLIELGGKGSPAVAAGNIEEGILLPKQAVTSESGKSKDLPQSDFTNASGKKGKKIDSSTGKKEGLEIASLLPGAGQGLIPLLSTSPSVPAVTAGTAPEQTAVVNQPQGAMEIPGGAQGAGGEADWLRPKKLGQSTVTSPVGPGIDPTSPEIPDPGFEIPGNNGVEAAKSSNDAGPIKAAVPRSPQVSHINEGKLLSAASLTIAPVVAHGSDRAPVYGPQYQVPSAAPSAASSVVGSSAATPNVFDRIDQGAAPVLLHSGVQHVSVGMRDPELGWVEIQTQSAAGHVDATLVTSSGQTHASLAAQLPAMAQFLEQRDVRVGTLIVHHHAMDAGGSGGGNGGPGYGSANPGAGGHHSDSRNSGGDRALQLSGRPALANSRSSSAVAAGAQTGEQGTALGAISYISVRA